MKRRKGELPAEPGEAWHVEATRTAARLECAGLERARAAGPVRTASLTGINGWRTEWVRDGEGSTAGLVLMFARMVGELTRDEYKAAVQAVKDDARTALRIVPDLSSGVPDRTDRERVACLGRMIHAAAVASLEGRATFEVRQ